MKISAATFPIKSIPYFVSSYALAFGISMAAITMTSVVAQYVYTWQPELISSQLLIGLSAAIAPFIVKGNERKVTLIAPILQDIVSDGNREKILVRELKKIEESAWANVFPLAITILGLFTLYLFGSPWRGSNIVAHNAFSIFVILFFLVTGTLGWQYISLILILFATSKFEVEANIFSWPAREIKRLNQITLEVYFSGVLVYLGAILAIWALPWGEFLLTNDNLFTRLWVFPIAVIVISYFLAIQFIIHRLLSMSKAIRLEKIDKKLEGLSDNHDDATFETNLKLMNEFIGWRKIVEAEPEWPLNLQTSLGVIGTVLIPTIVSISDIFAKFFGK